MAKIILADNGISFDGKSALLSPMGGAEKALVSLSESLVDLGHEVLVFNNCLKNIVYKGVNWIPISKNLPDSADLYIANRGDKLINLVPKAKHRVFWIHNPASYLMKWRYLHKLWRRRPCIVFSSNYHAQTYPSWAPAGERLIIPYGVDKIFRERKMVSNLPGPKAVFTSNPLRSLDWLLDLWSKFVFSRAPNAELHVFSGSATYGEYGKTKETIMKPILEKANTLADKGIVLREPVPSQDLVSELSASRIIVYRGDSNETFCSSLGEAQAFGVPAIVQDLGCVAERVIDNKTGYILDNEKEFADAIVRLLENDSLWKEMHLNCLKHQRNWSWGDAAKKFESIIN